MTSGAAYGSTDMEPVDGRVAVVAVIGAGASGSLATIYLLQAAAAARVPLRIVHLAADGRVDADAAVLATGTSRPLHRARCRLRLATSATPGCPGLLTALPTAARWSSSGRASPCWTWRSA